MIGLECKGNRWGIVMHYNSFYWLSVLLLMLYYMYIIVIYD